MIDPAEAKDIRWIPIDEIRPAPENDTLYGPIDPADPKIQQMATEMREEGKCRTLLTVSLDRYLMDGHRRRRAAKMAKLKNLQCIINPMLHSDPQFVSELIKRRKSGWRSVVRARRRIIEGEFLIFFYGQSR